jgi:hypothetical protein
MKGKCGYWQKCRLYARCVVCHEMEGLAYGHRAGGCYRDISKYGKKSVYFKNVAELQRREKKLVLRPA